MENLAHSVERQQRVPPKGNYDRLVLDRWTVDFASFGPVGRIQVGTVYSGSTERTHIGYSYGGGFEYALADNISLKTEFVRATLETQRLIGARVDGIGIALTHQPTVNLARAGVNFHFASWAAPAPVVARY